MFTTLHINCVILEFPGPSPLTPKMNTPQKTVKMKKVLCKLKKITNSNRRKKKPTTQKNTLNTQRKLVLSSPLQIKQTSV